MNWKHGLAVCVSFCSSHNNLEYLLSETVKGSLQGRYYPGINLHKFSDNGTLECFQVDGGDIYGYITWTRFVYYSCPSGQIVSMVNVLIIHLRVPLVHT